MIKFLGYPVYLNKDELTPSRRKTIRLAKYVLDNRCSVKDAAAVFDLSPSAAYGRLETALPAFCPELYSDLIPVLKINQGHGELNKKAWRRKHEQ